MHALLDALATLPETTRRAAGLLVAIARNRLELFALELREESLLLTRLLAWILAACFCFAMALLLATAVVILALPESSRLLGVAVAAALYALAGGAAVLIARRLLRRAGLPFAQSVNELKKDEAHL